MYLEDAMLALIVNPDRCDAAEVEGFCADAIGGGIDMIVVEGNNIDLNMKLYKICKANDALLAVTDISAFNRVEADCFVNMGDDISIGQAAGILLDGQKNGQYVDNINEALMSVEVGIDFLFMKQNFPDRGSLSAIDTSVPIYVGNVDSPEKAKEFAEAGIIRMFFNAEDYDKSISPTEYYAQVSRCIGRTL